MKRDLGSQYSYPKALAICKVLYHSYLRAYASPNRRYKRALGQDFAPLDTVHHSSIKVNILLPSLPYAMTSASFTPYWRQVGEPLNPYSFVFFVVAEIAGRRRPVAVVSSRAIPAALEESLQGTPLIAACQRIITVFEDKNKPLCHTRRISPRPRLLHEKRGGGLKEYCPGDNPRGSFA